MPWAKHNIVKGVYVIINIINNKKYVGIGMGKKGIHDRLSCYEGLRCKQQIKLYRAIKKYGWSNFRLIVIRETTNVSKARKIEKHLIKVNKLQDDKYGYNISDGGEGNPGYKHTEATKLLMRQNNVKRTGYHHSEKTKRKISESHMGMKYGEEFRRKCRERMLKANIKGSNHPRAVVAYIRNIVTNEMRFGCMKELGRELGFLSTNCLYNKTANGWIRITQEEYDNGIRNKAG